MNNSEPFHGNRPLKGPPTFLNQSITLQLSRKMVIGSILIVALLAFEMFNFDTTRYALADLLGDVSFFGLGWATILAIAFCAIDFAGLARLFTPEQGDEEPNAVWYLMGAWLLGATMNAMMTWWAISLTLLNHELGNEILSREQLLQWVPVFVATLVWLTRILFIGAFSVAGEHIFDLAGERAQRAEVRQQYQAAAAQRSQQVQPAVMRRQQHPTTTVVRTAPRTAAAPQTAATPPSSLELESEPILPQGKPIRGDKRDSMPSQRPPLPSRGNARRPVPRGARSGLHRAHINGQ